MHENENKTKHLGLRRIKEYEKANSTLFVMSSKTIIFSKTTATGRLAPEAPYFVKKVA